jgi:hypothetical protein
MQPGDLSVAGDAVVPIKNLATTGATPRATYQTGINNTEARFFDWDNGGRTRAAFSSIFINVETTLRLIEFEVFVQLFDGHLGLVFFDDAGYFNRRS